jgi:hypothetical protein
MYDEPWGYSEDDVRGAMGVYGSLRAGCDDGPERRGAVICEDVTVVDDDDDDDEIEEGTRT